MSGPAPVLRPAPPRPSGDLAGAYAGSVERLEAASGARSFLARLRRKRWMYALAASEEVLAAAAVVEGGWFAGAFAWAADRATGAVLMEASAAGVPWIHARVDGRTGPGAAARFSGSGLAVRIDRDVRGWILEVDSPSGVVTAALEVPRGNLPFTFVAAVPGRGVRATEKSGGLAATGEVRLGARRYSLAGGSGGVDVTAGVLPRETRWRWAFGTGRAAGAPFAFNLCEGLGIPAGEAGENAAFEGAAPYRLPAVTVHPGQREWRIWSRDGAVDLAFRPLAAHRERRNLGVLRTRFIQIAGAFEGAVPGRGGSRVPIEAMPGVVEDHWAVW